MIKSVTVLKVVGGEITEWDISGIIK